MNNGFEQHYFFKEDVLAGYVKQVDNNNGGMVKIEGLFEDGAQKMFDKDVPKNNADYFKQKQIVKDVMTKYTIKK